MLFVVCQGLGVSIKAAPSEVYIPKHSQQHDCPQKATEWRDNELGNDAIVLPGYTPLDIQDNAVLLYERKYDWEESYLPTSISSRGTPIAHEMKLVLDLSDRTLELAPESVTVVESRPDRVVISATGAPTPDLKVTTRTTVEYDGVAMVDIELIPKTPVEVRGLRFEVKISESDWMNILAFKANGIREQKGRNDFLKLPYHGDVLHILAFADGEKSFWWFVDDTNSWTSNNQPTTSLVREKDQLKLTQRIIGNRTRIDKSARFAINFMATPVKDLGTKWRRERVLWGIPSRSQAKRGVKYKLWWPTGFAYDAFPYTDYPGHTRKLLSKQDIDAYPGLLANKQKIKEAKQKYGIHILPYFSAHTLSTLDPMLKCFRSDWEIRPPRIVNGEVNPYSVSFHKPKLSHRAKSYSDYIIWRMNKEIAKLHMSGIYLDHGPVVDSMNPAHIDTTGAKGKYTPALDILGTRNFLKRLRTVYHNHGQPGYIFVHSSNREIIPALSFATAIVDGEQYRRDLRNGDYIDLIDIDEFRTRFANKQYGIFNVWQHVEINFHRDDPKWHGSEQQRRSFRNFMTLALAHDVPDWPQGAHKTEQRKLLEFLDQFGVDSADFVGYWDRNNAVHHNNNKLYVSYYQHSQNKSILLVVANLAEQQQKVSLRLDLTNLGIDKADTLLTIKDEQGNASLLTDTILNVRIPAKDFRLVWIQS